MGTPEITTEAAGSALSTALPPLPERAAACLRRLACRYVWWKTPDEAMQYPHRVAAQVMDLGTWEDLTAMIEATGEEYLRQVLRHAEAGQLDARSWHYWHYRLGLAEYGKKPVPPMPVSVGKTGCSGLPRLSDLRCFVEELIQNPPQLLMENLSLENDWDREVIGALEAKDADPESRRQHIVIWLNRYSAWQSFSNESRSTIAAQIVDYFDGSRANSQLKSAEMIVSEFESLERLIQPLAPHRRSGSLRDVTSLASKALWCCYPNDVPMFDSYVSKALQVFARLYSLKTATSQSRYAPFVEAWFQLFDEFADIINRAHDLRPDIWPFRSRILDRVLWILGQPTFDGTTS